MVDDLTRVTATAHHLHHLAAQFDIPVDLLLLLLGCSGAAAVGGEPVGEHGLQRRLFGGDGVGGRVLGAPLTAGIAIEPAIVNMIAQGLLLDQSVDAILLKYIKT
jgi:hypothetical protein